MIRSALIIGMLTLSASGQAEAKRMTNDVVALGNRCADNPALFDAHELDEKDIRGLYETHDSSRFRITGFTEGVSFGGGCLKAVRSVASGIVLYGDRTFSWTRSPFSLVKVAEKVPFESRPQQQPPDPALREVRFAFAGGGAPLPFIQNAYLGESHIGLWSDGKHSVIGIVNCKPEGKCGSVEPVLVSSHAIKQIGYMGSPDGQSSGQLTMWVNLSPGRDAVIILESHQA